MRFFSIIALVAMLAGCSSSPEAATTTVAPSSTTTSDSPTTLAATTTAATTTTLSTTTTSTTMLVTTTTAPAATTTVLEPWQYVIHNVETLSGTTTSAGLYTTVQDMTGWDSGYGWGGLAQLFVGSQLGDWIEFVVPITLPGRYEVEMWLTRAPDFGLVRVTIDGVDIDDVDLYHTEVMPTQGLSMGEFDLAPGPHTVRLTVLGKSPQSTGTSFGIDTITVIGPY